MAGPRAWIATVAWPVALALLPWWLGLPLLLAIAAALLVAAERLGQHAPLLRRALRWGVPGVLLALVRALGWDAFALGAGLLGVLVGYTLLAGLEAWLDRDLRRAPAAAVPEWRELALAPVGPPVTVIRLEPPAWHERAVPDPRGGRVDWSGNHRGSFELAGGRLESVGTRACFSPDGRWFAARLARGRGTCVLDRDRGRHWRLRGWMLCGWAPDGPWLLRGDGPPAALGEVLGEPEE